MVDSELERTWGRLQPELVSAYSTLINQLRESESYQDLLDSYLSAKRVSADAFQALLRARLPDHGVSWQRVRRRLEYEMSRRFGDILPEWAMEIPYGSTTHRELFSVLCEQLTQPVSADLLRVVTADAVHAERRVRELRELGLDIVPAKVSGANTYTLRSLEIDASFVRNVAANNIKSNKKLDPKRRDDLLSAIAE